MNPIVCDTGPILHLQEAGLLELLNKAGNIYIPQVVNIELKELYPQWENIRPNWLHVESLSPDETSQAELLSASGLLDSGEAATPLSRSTGTIRPAITELLCNFYFSEATLLFSFPIDNIILPLHAGDEIPMRTLSPRLLIEISHHEGHCR